MRSMDCTDNRFSGRERERELFVSENKWHKFLYKLHLPCCTTFSTSPFVSGVSSGGFFPFSSFPTLSSMPVSSGSFLAWRQQHGHILRNHLRHFPSSLSVFFSGTRSTFIDSSSYSVTSGQRPTRFLMVSPGILRQGKEQKMGKRKERSSGFYDRSSEFTRTKLWFLI